MKMNKFAISILLSFVLVLCMTGASLANTIVYSDTFFFEVTEPEPTATEEELIEPEVTEAPIVYDPKVAVVMVTEYRELYYYGDKIVLKAVVSEGDPEIDYTPYITWQRSLDGTNWEAAEGTVIKNRFTFVMSEENSGYMWRAALELPEEAPVEPTIPEEQA